MFNEEEVVLSIVYTINTAISSQNYTIEALTIQVTSA